jgi:hypothetical protein
MLEMSIIFLGNRRGCPNSMLYIIKNELKGWGHKEKPVQGTNENK